METLIPADTSEADIVSEPTIETNVPSASDPKYPSIWQSVGIVCIVIVFMIGCAPIFLSEDQLGYEVAMLAYYVAAWGLSFAAIHSIRRRKLGTSTYSFRINSWQQVIALAVGTVALVFGVVGPIQSLIPMPEAVAEIFSELGELTGPVGFTLLVLAAPLIEELIFRGIMLDGLLKRYRPSTAILVSSLAFGFVHLNPWQFVTGLVLGLFLGWVYYRTRSVGACIVIHMAANLNAFVSMWLASGTTTQTETVDFFTPFGGVRQFIIFTGICWGVITLSVLFLRREFNRADLRDRELALAREVNAEL